ncbi:MAG: epoxyqueuosine reductase QueH [Acidobacteria bacterium]|nr:epoxyqueuosine reductase QueH [Acidobacteriota bacterium]
MKKKLLLHICCAPDASWIPEKLEQNYEVTCFFYNPNIYPEEEHEKRADEMRRLAETKGYRLAVPPFEPEKFDRRTATLRHQPEKAGRCSICYRIRLEKTAAYAKENGFDLFATVLTVSPHKRVERVNRIGKAVAEKYGVEYLPSDFKKDDGFKKSVEESKKYKLYRQDYCGCESSLRYRKMFKDAETQAFVPLVPGKKVGIYDVQSFRRWLKRKGLKTGFLFFETQPTAAVFKEAYEESIFLEPVKNLEWRKKIFTKKDRKIKEIPLHSVSNRDIFSDPF